MIELNNQPFPNQSGAAPFFGIRAWVLFNGTGTVAINASGNVSSITDRGVGLYTVNFTIPMPDTSYALAGSVESFNGNNVVAQQSAALGTPPSAVEKAVGSCQIAVVQPAGLADGAAISVLVIR